jgi:Cof subfamily protein (haloacid dehalogenase superfamily)
MPGGTLAGVLPRLIATDLDGTLLDPAGRLSDRAATALRAAHDAGITVVFASGRPPFVAATEIERTAGAVSYGVMANGSFICTLPDGEPLRVIEFGARLAFDAVRALRAADGRFGFALATDRGFTHEAGFTERMPVHHGGPPPVADVLAGHDTAELAIKLLVFHGDLRADELLDRIPPIIGTTLEATHMGAEAVELGPPGADKGTGLRWLCDYLHIDAADVLVYGDELNDLPMMSYAGRAVAVANAAAPVLAAADETCDSHAQDGVARHLEALLRAAR